MKYAISKATSLSYQQTIDKVTDELKKEGFGVLTTIDVSDALKKKLDVDFPKYIILGACNPSFAHKALRAEDEIGVLLPCNVIVYEKNGNTHVSALDPLVIQTLLDNPVIHSVAIEIQQRLQRVIEAV